MSHTDNPLPSDLLVVCLCAQWCGSCREYAGRFEQVKSEFTQATFRWIDVEDEADLVDPVEIENFPTLLLVRGTEAVFFGPVAPHVQTLERLVQTCLQDPPPLPLANADVRALARRLQEQAKGC